jgi:hypothetical protein
MKKKCLLAILGLALLVVTIPAFALEVAPGYWTGSRTSGTGQEIISTGTWAPDGWFRIEWSISPDTNNSVSGYDYWYRLSWSGQDLSHFILGASRNFTAGNIIGSYDDIGWFIPGGNGNSNPGLPQTLYGIKFDYSNGTSEGNTVQYSFFSDRVPMWGSFYAKSGNNDGGTYAYNWGLQHGAAIPDGNFSLAWYIPVPDTTTSSVPEPGTLLLLGLGLLGIGGMTRRK